MLDNVFKTIFSLWSRSLSKLLPNFQMKLSFFETFTQSRKMLIVSHLWFRLWFEFWERYFCGFVACSLLVDFLCKH